MASAGLFDALFYNSGSHDSPTLVKIDGIENLELSLERNKIPIKIRRFDTELNLTGQRVIGLTFDLLTEPGTTVWDFLHTKFINGDPFEVFAFYKYTDDSGAPTAGDKAYRIFGELAKFPLKQDLESADMGQVEFVPSIKLESGETTVQEPAVYTEPS